MLLTKTTLAFIFRATAFERNAVSDFRVALFIAPRLIYILKNVKRRLPDSLKRQDKAPMVVRRKVSVRARKNERRENGGRGEGEATGAEDEQTDVTRSDDVMRGLRDRGLSCRGPDTLASCNS